MSIESFFTQYFVNPLYIKDAPYNIVNTPVYGIVLAAVVFLTYKLLKKLEVKIDKDFFIATLPFILLATVLHVLYDAGVYDSILLVSPLIYIMIFGIAIGALFLSLGVQRFTKIKYNTMMFAIGTIMLFLFGAGLRFPEFRGGIQIVSITLLVSGALYVFSKIEPKIVTPMNLWILIAAMFDATSTFVGMSMYGYGEKHVLPSFLISHTGAWIMFPLKFLVIMLALYAIDRLEEDAFFRNFLKFAILCLTLGPGMRNTIRLMMGV